MSDFEKTPIVHHSMFNNITDIDAEFSVNNDSEISFNQKIKLTSRKSLILTIFNIFRSFVAIGVLTLPYASSLVGPLIAIPSMLLVSVLVFLATHCIIEIADDSKFKGANYETLGRLLWGKIGQRLIVVILYFVSFACFIGGILFTADFLDFAFCSHNVEGLCHSKIKYLLAAFIFSIFISLIQSLKPFGYISIISTIVIMIAIVSITVYNMKFILHTDINLGPRLGEFNIRNFFTFLGIGLYTIEGINLILPIRASYNNNGNYPRVFYSTFVFVVWCYLLLAILSYIVN